MTRRFLAWLLGRDELTRLEALRIIVQAEVITPTAKVRPFLNLRVVRDARRRVA